MYGHLRPSERTDPDRVGETEEARQSSAKAGLTVAIGIATANRPKIVAATVRHLVTRPDPPDRVVISVAQLSDIDLDGLGDTGSVPVEILLGPQGASAQRNTVIDQVIGEDLILFLDDDFLVEDGYVRGLRRLFEEDAAVVMATGDVLADGLRGPGFEHAEGLARLSAQPRAPEGADLKDIYSVYGCNMALRSAVARSHGERFDEALPLYSWLEDVGFSRQMAAHGRIVFDNRLRGVHLATKVGRGSGVRLGYSQIANPIHLVRQGNLHLGWALRIMTGNVLANSVKSLWPETWIDRRGRLRGNLLALRDLLARRLDPPRVLEIDDGPKPVQPDRVMRVALDDARRLSRSAAAGPPPD